MSRPTSFRFPEELLARLNEEAGKAGLSANALAAAILDEGLKARLFPGITYRGGVGGPRAVLEGGPDVWEVVRDIKDRHGSLSERVRTLAGEIPLSAPRIRLALDFYATFPEEIDALIAQNEQAGARLRELAARREQLLVG